MFAVKGCTLMTERVRMLSLRAFKLQRRHCLEVSRETAA